jgi:hypothetical protein
LLGNGVLRKEMMGFGKDLSFFLFQRGDLFFSLDVRAFFWQGKKGKTIFIYFHSLCISTLRQAQWSPAQ